MQTIPPVKIASLNMRRRPRITVVAKKPDDGPKNTNVTVPQVSGVITYGPRLTFMTFENAIPALMNIGFFNIYTIINGYSTNTHVYLHSVSNPAESAQWSQSDQSWYFIRFGENKPLKMTILLTRGLSAIGDLFGERMPVEQKIRGERIRL